MVLALAACERDTYTTWTCKGPQGGKSTMVLRKAMMQLHGVTLHYCGSLGEKSFFDAACPADIQHSQILFMPNSGQLLDHEQESQCELI